MITMMKYHFHWWRKAQYSKEPPSCCTLWHICLYYLSYISCHRYILCLTPSLAMQSGSGWERQMVYRPGAVHFSSLVQSTLFANGWTPPPLQNVQPQMKTNDGHCPDYIQVSQGLGRWELNGIRQQGIKNKATPTQPTWFSIKQYTPSSS